MTEIPFYLPGTFPTRRDRYESLDFDPGKLARVAGQFITPEGNQVHRVRLDAGTVYVAIPRSGQP